MSLHRAHDRVDRSDHAHTGLATCVVCSRDFVTPVLWEPVGHDRWWIYVRCAECGVGREITVSNEVATSFDDELAIGQRAIQRAASALERERMAADVEAFVAALRHDLIEPSYFDR